MSLITLPAPAKLNLFLHITGRRDDGYHELQTLFQLIDLCDYLQFQATTSTRIRVYCPGLSIPEEKNLVYKAALLLQQYSNSSKHQGVDITIRKTIPIGAGLGGGSSNAASTLLALNHLWGLKLSQATLIDLSCELGADVPLFVLGYSAWATGIGDTLIPITLPTRWYLMIKPEESISTASVFASNKLTRNTSRVKMSELDIENLELHQTRNDCEPAAIELCPTVATTLEWLSQYGRARMSGSGSACFVEFKDPCTAAKAYHTTLKSKQPGKATVVTGINISPTQKSSACCTLI